MLDIETQEVLSVPKKFFCEGNKNKGRVFNLRNLACLEVALWVCCGLFLEGGVGERGTIIL